MKYTHYYEAEDSSVIDQVWYNANDEKMVVGLLNGTLCGYQGVPLPVYEAFTKQEELGGSIGSYWNNFIKKGLAGFDTAGLEDEDFFADVDTEEVDEPYVDQDPVASNDDDTDLAQLTYEVTFTFENETTEFSGSLFVFADNQDSALDKFGEAADLLGYTTVDVKSITQFF